MPNRLKNIEDFANEIYDLIKVTRDSCGYNEYFAQESTLNKALELQEALLEELFELGKVPYGTGSYPPSLRGWHLQIRLIPSQPPLNNPYFRIACLVYSEQVG